MIIFINIFSVSFLVGFVLMLLANSAIQLYIGRYYSNNDDVVDDDDVDDDNVDDDDDNVDDDDDDNNNVNFNAA